MESGGLGSGVLKSGGGVRGVEVGGSGELESGGLGSENLGFGVGGVVVGGWGQKSWGRGVESGVWGRGGGVEIVGIRGLALRGLRSGGWSQED